MTKFQYIIRTAKKSDIEQIANVASTTYRTTFGPFASKETIDKSISESRSIEYFSRTFESHSILVACVDDSIVGYIQYGPVSYDTKFANYSDEDLMVEQLYVLEEFQKKGIGNTLMKEMLNRLSSIENVNMFLDVWPQSQHVVNFYQKHGFKKVGELPYYDDGKLAGHDDIMVKPLRRDS